MANRRYVDNENVDPRLLGLSDNASNDYMTEDESTTSYTQRYPQQSYAQQDYHNSLQTGPAAFPTGRTPFTGSYEELAAQGRGPPPYPTQPAPTLPQSSNAQFSTSFEDIIQGPASPLRLSQFSTREPVVAAHDTYVGWYIRPPMINLLGIGDVVPIASPFDVPAFGNFPPSNLATPTGPPASRPAPPRRRRNQEPPTPIEEATLTPFANSANIPPAAIEAFGVEGREDPGPVHKESVMKQCTCYAGRKGKIPRPSNAFILYRSANSKRGKDHLRKTGNLKAGAAEISRICGVWWSKMSEAEKEPWRQKEEEEKEEHKRLYPDYHYDPGAVYKQSFGTVDCKCGAYEYNMQQRQLRKDREKENPSGNGKKRGRGGPKQQQPVLSMDEGEGDIVDEHYGDDSDAYVPPGEKAKGKRPMKRQKTGTRTSFAPATSASAGPSRTTSQAMDQYIEQDYQTPTQQTFQESINAGRASRQQTPPRSYATPPRELRTQPNISYAEPANEGFEDTDMSGTDDNRDFGIDNLVHFDDADIDNMLDRPFDFDGFDIDPTYKAPSLRLSGFGRRSRRGNGSRSFYTR